MPVRMIAAEPATWPAHLTPIGVHEPKDNPWVESKKKELPRLQLVTVTALRPLCPKCGGDRGSWGRRYCSAKCRKAFWICRQQTEKRRVWDRERKRRHA
jgi:tRNA(Ile2) C34 agmatinyltransferase TiaS